MSLSVHVSPTKSNPFGGCRKGAWLSELDRDKIAEKWQSEGYGPIITGMFKPDLSKVWTIRKWDIIITIAEGTVECIFSLVPGAYTLTKGDEVIIPSCRSHRIVCTKPAMYYMAYKMFSDDEEDDNSHALKSYYTNCKSMESISPRGIVDFSARVPELPPMSTLPTVSTQLYITPTTTLCDSDGMQKEASEIVESNPRLRKRRLRVTVVEGCDLPAGTDSLYRVNLYYKDQVASTRTKLGHQNVTWDDTFLFEGSDKYLTVELQGIDRTRVNLDDFYDALFECSDSVVIWVRVPMVSDKPLEECSRIKLALQAEFNPRRDSTAEQKQLLSQKPLARSMADMQVTLEITPTPPTRQSLGVMPSSASATEDSSSVRRKDREMASQMRTADQGMQLAAALFVS